MQMTLKLPLLRVYRRRLKQQKDDDAHFPKKSSRLAASEYLEGASVCAAPLMDRL